MTFDKENKTAIRLNSDRIFLDEHGFALCTVILKETREMIGQCVK